jgi:hypothetical protein
LKNSKLEVLKTNFRTRATRMTDRANEEGSPFDREEVGIGLFVDFISRRRTTESKVGPKENTLEAQRKMSNTIDPVIL